MLGRSESVTSLFLSGMSKQIVDHREKYEEEPFWLDNAFLGMPRKKIFSFSLV